MFQIKRFDGFKKATVAKTGSAADSSALVLQSLLKRAEDRKLASDKSKDTVKKRNHENTSNDTVDKSRKRKKIAIVPSREETTQERDLRKASAKEDKKLRKDVERGSKSTGIILVKKKVIVITDSTIKETIEPSSQKLECGTLSIASEVVENNEVVQNIPTSKNLAEQLRPSGKVRDESQKVLSQKRTDDDEDFIEENDDEVIVTDLPKPMTVAESIESWGLNGLIAENLIEDGIDHFFPVQRMVIPQLLRNNSRLCVQPRDMCISAPTGSGKTIAYALPILQSLKDRSQVRLRALLLLPSRELATQVYGVFCRLSRGTDLAIAVCTGQTPLEDEQRLIMGACYSGSGGGRHSLYSGVNSDTLFSNRNLYFDSPTNLGISAVDILICTPGRLLDHIQYTEGFTLQHLRFLVLDEADRLLGNAYHSWVRTLVQSAHSTEAASVGGLNTTHKSDTSDSAQGASRKDNIAVAGDFSLPFLATPQQPLQRLLFSATLTDNPRKLEMLGIRNPLIMRATSSDVVPNTGSDDIETIQNTVPKGEVARSDSPAVTNAASGYVVPHTLEESITICETAKRPLVLISMLLEATGIPAQYAGASTTAEREEKIVSSLSKIADICKEVGSMLLVFSSSVETTHRLCRLLQLFNNSAGTSNYIFGGKVAEMSRLMRSDERESIMRDATLGDIKILVSSDHMARGIDLPNIKLVVNYDPPKHAKMYVHRVGRTARANRVGHSVTLLKAGQVGAFKKMRGTIGSSSASAKLLKYRSNAELMENIDQNYCLALQKLPAIIDKEANRQLAVGDQITSI